MNSKLQKKIPVLGITMGDPVGIGPEIISMWASKCMTPTPFYPVIIGNISVLDKAAEACGVDVRFQLVSEDNIDTPENVFPVIQPDSEVFQDHQWGVPTPETGRAMVDYIRSAVRLTKTNTIDAIITAPINKLSMNLSGTAFNGHTELLAHDTNTRNYAMMLAGPLLRVVLVTIHQSISTVAESITSDEICRVTRLTHQQLESRFGIKYPRIAVAGLNPHAGESGMFGDEEQTTITPAVNQLISEGMNVSGPHPPDTLFHFAAKGIYDAVICMYHDQGLIPFKIIHFEDGVNTTLGLPIIRCSVDHGTAYEIAGTGTASESSLAAAIDMAAMQVMNSKSAAS